MVISKMMKTSIRSGLVIHIKPQNRPPPKPIQTEDDLDAKGVTEEEGEGEGDYGGAGRAAVAVAVAVVTAREKVTVLEGPVMRVATANALNIEGSDLYGWRR